ncbi:MAG: TolC family protein [Spirosomaceae bacterium]|nr:TolC family protein [Spirosomataceae bacterium]
MHKKVLILSCLLLFKVVLLKGQTADQERYMTYLDFYGLVIQNHPVVKLAELEIDYAAAELMMARGAFDPKVMSTYDRKSINGLDYYNEWIADLKVPIWGGIDIKAGREQNIGSRLNPELTSGISTYAGISVPLGRGLLIEERRNTLMQVRIYQDIAVAERQKLINKIIFSAAKDYWNWYLAFQVVNFNKEGLDLAENRFQFVREQVRVGEKAGVDSVEAKITLQTRILNYQNSLVDFRNATLYLSNYLWGKNNEPVELSETVIPPPLASPYVEEAEVQRLLIQARNNHPEIRKLILKNEQLVIQERFQREMLKPQLDFNYNFIDTPKYNLSELGVIRTNNKIGVVFEMPLYLRKERGKLQQVRIKQLQISNDQRQLTREIVTDVNASYNLLNNLKGLIELQADVVKNQTFLLSAEQEKFRIGESSLFLINSREAKLIDEKIKAEELKAKYEKALAELIYSAGQNSLP